MLKVHAYLDNKTRVLERRMEHLPRVGDTVRLPMDKYATVTEVIWCFDEEWPEGQRVNLRLMTLKEDT